MYRVQDFGFKYFWGLELWASVCLEFQGFGM